MKDLHFQVLGVFANDNSGQLPSLSKMANHILKQMPSKAKTVFALFFGCNVKEDEVHFLFQCPTYSMIRNKFYYKVKTLIPNITQLSINGLINELMNSSKYFINIQFIKYISACFDVRDKLLSK